jgi:tetratricopeptide (TPR) repeat protein
VLGLVVLAVAGLAYVALRPRLDPERVWAEGQAGLRAGRIDQARAALTKLSRLRAPTPLDWMFRGQVEVAEGHAEEALEALSQVPDSHKIAPQARLMAGQVELRMNRVRLAERWLREAIRLDPTLVQGHRELIYILGYQLRRADLDAEFDALSRCSELTFDNAFHWCLLRSAHWEPPSAIPGLERFVAADPEDRWSRLALAENYRRCGLTGEAEAVVAPLAADDPEALGIRVLLLFDRRQHEEAERLLNSAPPDLPSLARLRGQVALSHRDAAAAVHHFRLAEQDEPDNRETVFGLINALTLLGDEQAAAPLRLKARQIDDLNSLVDRASSPNAQENLELLRSLGAACTALGQIRAARAWYKLVLAAEPLDPQAQQALFRLQGRDDEPPGRRDSGRSAADSTASASESTRHAP